MLQHLDNLVEIKLFLKNKFHLNVLESLDTFPTNLDNLDKDYYQEIAKKFVVADTKKGNEYGIIYYIKKIKLIYINSIKFYEVTLSPANDLASKFDHIVAFTKISILKNYAIKISFCTTEINVFGKNIPIKFIKDYQISIRPCELKNILKIFGQYKDFQRSNKEYSNLMILLKTNYLTIDKLVQAPQILYEQYKSIINEKARISILTNLFDSCRELILNRKPGHNLIIYLLYIMNNKIIKSQMNLSTKSYKLSNLYLLNGSIPFDDMPFATSPKKHVPNYIDLCECINKEGREHELLSR
jgi:hypothetical protein